MLLGLSAQEVKEWNESLHSYERAKRTKRPFGRAPPAVEHRSTIDVLEKEMRFNPVLQSFRDAREESRTIEQEEVQRASEQMKYLRNNYKHAADYDIITLAHPSLPLPLPPAQRSASLAPEVRRKEHKDPTFQGYNIINGRNYDQEYLRKAGFRAELHHPRHIRPELPRAYNIVSGRYASNHEERQQAEQAEADREAVSKSQELRVYDSVSGSFYNPELEEQFQAARRQQEAAHALAAPKLPPSYLNREAYAQADPALPSQVVLELDRRGQQAKQRYKLRGMVQQEHRARGEYLSEKREQQARRRVHSGRVMEEKAREFNIINAQRYAEGRAEELFGKEVTGSPDKIVPPSSVKSRGFAEYQQ